MNKIIELKDVKKIYNQGKANELVVLKDIDLEIIKGDMIAIYGPSGSGKSTLLHIIGCLDRATSGKVLIEGKDTSKLLDNELALIRREKIGFVFQQFNLINVFTALENVEMPLIIAGKSKSKTRKRATELLKSIGLGERLNHFPNQLSGGEIQRVAIARALANEPSVILADEPTGNLDSKTGSDIINLMKDLNGKGFTFIIVTHDSRITKSVKRVISIQDGKILR
jgi:putative ABC transport system ATP-binding protein